MEKEIQNRKKGKLSVVATPIGNLKDITLRALETLKEADVIYAEDTRVTIKLLKHYSINTPIHSFHAHSPLKVIDGIINRLKKGEYLALTTDAGTPGVSDPGGELISHVKRFLPEVRIEPIPGPAALTAAFSISGIQSAGFVFLGYPPHKKGRVKFFERLTSQDQPVILYESKHRIIKTLQNLGEVLAVEHEITVFCDLTKKFEHIQTGTAAEILEHFNKNKPQGEFVIIIPFLA